MELQTVKNVISNFAEEVLEKSVQIVDIEREDGGWRIKVEALEETDYTRRYARDDQYGVYVIELDQDLEVVSCQRKGFRSRGTA